MTNLAILTAQALRDFEKQLGDLLARSEASWAAIVDKGGNLFAQSGRTNAMEISTLCALAAGSFAATHELAKRLGQTDFVALYHEGDAANILMSALAQDALLVIVFDSAKTNIGLVKFYAQQTSGAFNAQLEGMAGEEGPGWEGAPSEKPVIV